MDRLKYMSISKRKCKTLHK